VACSSLEDRRRQPVHDQEEDIETPPLALTFQVSAANEDKMKRLCVEMEGTMKHECKRFKTKFKRGGIRLLVECRQCCKVRQVFPMFCGQRVNQ
jgi:hypothetical protein